MLDRASGPHQSKPRHVGMTPRNLHAHAMSGHVVHVKHASRGWPHQSSSLLHGSSRSEGAGSVPFLGLVSKSTVGGTSSSLVQSATQR